MYGAKRIKDSTVQNYFSTQLQVSPRARELISKTQQKLKFVQNGHVLRGGEGKEFMRSKLNNQISHNLP